MLIQSAAIQFGHVHDYKEAFSQTETVVNRAESQPLANDELSLPVSAAQVSLQSEVTTATASASSIELDSDTMRLDAYTFKMKMLVESFTGKDIDLNGAIDLQTSESSPPPTEPVQPQGAQVVRLQQSYFEQESSLFMANGQITLDSGAVVSVDFSQFAQREFFIENSQELVVGEVEVQDPLVINLAGAGLSLTQDTFAFDIDSNGSNESVVFATANSGFLALDKNGNGQIDNGSELFGALTGNGFAELAAYDDDGNNFIDSGDAIFSQLLFYQKDSNGNDIIKPIADVNIGAFYLGSTETPFQVKSSTNELQAIVRSSGLYLSQDGSAGSLQQIDLVV